MHTKCIFQGPCKETTLAVYMAIKKCACGPNLLMANDMALGTPNAKLFFFYGLMDEIQNFLGPMRKMRENEKTRKVKKWRIFPVKVAYFSV